VTATTTRPSSPSSPRSSESSPGSTPRRPGRLELLCAPHSSTTSRGSTTPSGSNNVLTTEALYASSKQLLHRNPCPQDRVNSRVAEAQSLRDSLCGAKTIVVAQSEPTRRGLASGVPTGPPRGAGLAPRSGDAGVAVTLRGADGSLPARCQQGPLQDGDRPVTQGLGGILGQAALGNGQADRALTLPRRPSALPDGGLRAW
jgi:hypothetical protein